MEGAISFILLIWLIAEVNFRRRSKAKTSSDFDYTPEEQKQLADHQFACQKAETRAARAHRDWEKLDSTKAGARWSARLRRYDERSSLGKRLNRELPRLEQALKKARKDEQQRKFHLSRHEQLPALRKNRWIRAESFRGACRHTLLLLPVWVVVAGNLDNGAPDESGGSLVFFLWAGTAGCLALGYSISTRAKLKP